MYSCVAPLWMAFVAKCINTNEINLWARMEKIKLKMWKSVRQAVKHKLPDQVVELKNDRSLLAC